MPKDKGTAIITPVVMVFFVRLPSAMKRGEKDEVRKALTKRGFEGIDSVHLDAGCLKVLCHQPAHDRNMTMLLMRVKDFLENTLGIKAELG